MNNQDRLNRIQTYLQHTLSPSFLEVCDESQQHVGHPGAQGGAGHFAVTIASAEFSDKSLLDCHRLIYDALKDMMSQDIHALRISIMKHPLPQSASEGRGEKLV